MRQPQTETIKWMPYPDNEPEDNDSYFVQVTNSWGKEFVTAEWRDSVFTISTDTHYSVYRILDNVIAYAEMPKGYKG